MQVKRNKLIKGVLDNEHAISKKKLNTENNLKGESMAILKETILLIMVVLVLKL